jgi:hypothetical protein
MRIEMARGRHVPAAIPPGTVVVEHEEVRISKSRRDLCDGEHGKVIHQVCSLRGNRRDLNGGPGSAGLAAVDKAVAAIAITP